MTLILPHDLGIANASGLKQQLIPCVRQASPLLLDGSQVRRVHTASLQILSALFLQRSQSSLETQWSAASMELCEAASLSGLQYTLKLTAPTTLEQPDATPHPDC